jgi:hypothetical protein
MTMLEAIIKESNVIAKHPSIHRVPPFEMAMSQFLNLLAQIRKKVQHFYSMFYVKMRSPELFLNKMQPISDLLIEMTDWLMRRRKEIEMMCSLLSDTNLPMADLKTIKKSVSSGKVKLTRVFILKIDYAQDPLIDNMARFIKNQKPFKIPVFWIATSGKHRIDQVIRSLKFFDYLRVTQRSSMDCKYQIGLVSISSSYKNGAIIPFGYSVKELPTEVTAAELPDKPI